MSRIHWRLPRQSLVLALFALVAIGVGVAVAAIPSGGTFTGCYANSGALRVIDTDSGQTCRSGETLIRWSQQGPKGDPGAPGPPGPPGPAGTANIVMRFASGTAGPQSATEATAVCESGEVATGGGFQIVQSSDPPPEITDSLAQTIGGEKPNAWHVVAQNHSDSTIIIGAQVLCAPGS